jgi:hypothetical protein
MSGLRLVVTTHDSDLSRDLDRLAQVFGELPPLTLAR